MPSTYTMSALSMLLWVRAPAGERERAVAAAESERIAERDADFAFLVRERELRRADRLGFAAVQRRRHHALFHRDQRPRSPLSEKMLAAPSVWPGGSLWSSSRAALGGRDRRPVRLRRRRSSASRCRAGSRNPRRRDRCLRDRAHRRAQDARRDLPDAASTCGGASGRFAVADQARRARDSPSRSTSAKPAASPIEMARCAPDRTAEARFRRDLSSSALKPNRTLSQSESTPARTAASTTPSRIRRSAFAKKDLRARRARGRDR